MGRQLPVMGDERRFSVVAEYVENNFSEVKYIADVAGGRGYLSRILSKKNYDCELIELREKVVKGVKHRIEEFKADMADYYDLLIGLHPDEATRELAKAALIRPVILIPCCNFWDDKRRGLKDLLAAIKNFYKQNSVSYHEHQFDFSGPMNRGLISFPNKGSAGASPSQRGEISSLNRIGGEKNGIREIFNFILFGSCYDIHLVSNGG